MSHRQESALFSEELKLPTRGISPGSGQAVLPNRSISRIGMNWTHIKICTRHSSFTGVMPSEKAPVIMAAELPMPGESILVLPINHSPLCSMLFSSKSNNHILHQRSKCPNALLKVRPISYSLCNGRTSNFPRSWQAR